MSTPVFPERASAQGRDAGARFVSPSADFPVSSQSQTFPALQSFRVSGPAPKSSPSCAPVASCHMRLSRYEQARFLHPKKGACLGGMRFRSDAEGVPKVFGIPSRGAPLGTSFGSPPGTFRAARQDAAQRDTAPVTVSSPSISSVVPLAIAQPMCFETFPCVTVLYPFPGSWAHAGSN